MPLDFFLVKRSQKAECLEFLHVRLLQILTHAITENNPDMR